ncbi:MAG TPA: histidine kinase [Actinomycetota bacterium]|jgi:signal transduction histidine kinase|nr:histidine kinase [Actinomycetota bacterium]
MKAPATTTTTATATSATATSSPTRRSLRDWIVDTSLFLVAALFGLGVIGGYLESSAPPMPAWLLTVDVTAGALGCAGLWLRRRWPVGLALVLVALSTFSEVVGGAMIVALFSVAIHRPPRITMRLFALSVLAALVYVVVRPEPGEPWLLLFLFGVAIQGAAVGWGLFIRARRQLIESLRDRAARAETEAQLRAEQAQQRARDEIAREMHDVLGHRLSLLSVHAGALEFRPGASPEEIAGAAKVIRENAHQALQDLREVIGVLRAPVGELPQPTLADVRELVAESDRAGMRVGLGEEVGGAVPDLVGRTAYRVVQEALTNARKHAPGAAVDVHLAGGPGQGLTVEVCNQPPDPGPADAPAGDPGTGQGLVGLAERVALASGRLEHGPTPAGGWRLVAWLPWPA